MAVRTAIAIGVFCAATVLAVSSGSAASDVDGVETRPLLITNGTPAVTMKAGGGSASARSRAAARAAAGLSAPAPRAPEAVPLDLPSRDVTDHLLEIAVGSTRKIPLSQPVTDVIIAKPTVADVVVRDPSSVFLVGRGAGKTSIFLVGRGGQILQELDVLVVADLDGARLALKKYLPDARIALEPVGEGVLMTGWVRNAQEAAGAQSVVEAYLNSARMPAQEQGAAAAMLGLMGAGQAEDGGGQSPTGPGSRAGDAASGGSGEVTIINALRIASDQQVLLQVRVAEMRRSTLKRLGVNVFGDATVPRAGSDYISSGTGGGQTSVLGSLLLPDVTGAAVEGALRISKWGIDGIAYSILEQQGLVKVLAEPALVAMNGETANFLAGGEIPMPIEGNDDNIKIQFKDFGVGLSFTPVVLANDQLSLRIASEVSRISPDNAISVPTAGGTVTLPGLSVRRAESTIMLPSGGSLMIAGLLENNEYNSFSGVPGLMDLPILGALFRSQDFQTNRTELVIMVQAFVVRPTDFAAKLALPTDGFVPASDMDIYVMGRLMHGYGDPNDPARERLSLAGPLGYIME